MPNHFKVDPKDHVGLYVPAGEVFPEINGTFDELSDLLRKLPRQETLFTCAHLNLVVSNPVDTKFNQQQYVLSWFLTPEQVDRVNQFASKHHGQHRTSVMFRGQLLELMRWASLLCLPEIPNGRIDVEFEARNDFARAALICSGIWAQRVYGQRFGFDQQKSDESKRQSLGAVRNAVVESWDGLNPSRAASRGQALFFDYLPNVYPEFPELFKEVTGLSLEQYFDCWNAIIGNYLPTPVQIDKNRNGVISRDPKFDIQAVSVQRPQMQGVWDTFFGLEAQTIDELTTAMSDGNPKRTPEVSHAYPYKALRSRPILRAADGKAILMDPAFCTDKLAHGPLFYFQAHKALLRSNREPMASFGKAFEQYVNAQLDGMFNPKSTVLAKRFTPNPLGKDRKGNIVEVLDGVLNDAAKGPVYSIHHAVFFQTKANWLVDEDHFDDDPERYANKLLDKYANHPGSGLRQLFDAIAKLEKGDLIPDDPSILQPTLIYPVIAAYDSLLDAPVHAHLLAERFEQLLQPDEKLANGNMRKGSKIILPLIVLTVDTLEDLESSVRDFPFVDLLKDYNRDCPERAISLKTYVGSTGYRDHLRNSAFLANAGLRSFDRTLRNVFNEDKSNVLKIVLSQNPVEQATNEPKSVE